MLSRNYAAGPCSVASTQAARSTMLPDRWTSSQHGEGRADTAAGAATGRELSQISHGLTGRHWTMASTSDTEQDVDVRIRIPAHWSDALH